MYIEGRVGNEFFELSGDSANAVPHYQKLRSRVTHIWGYRRGQPNRSAMVRPRPGRTASMITVSPEPGKYDSVKVLRGGRLNRCIQKKVYKRSETGGYVQVRFNVACGLGNSN